VSALSDMSKRLLDASQCRAAATSMTYLPHVQGPYSVSHLSMTLRGRGRVASGPIHGINSVQEQLLRPPAASKDAGAPVLGASSPCGWLWG
jgi:hypothetical protein